MGEETEKKPGPWEHYEGRSFRRAAVSPNVLCHVHQRKAGYEWQMMFGLPGVCADMAFGSAPTLEAACAAADAAALVMIDATIARMQEARAARPGTSLAHLNVGNDVVIETHAGLARGVRSVDVVTEHEVVVSDGRSFHRSDGLGPVGGEITLRARPATEEESATGGAGKAQSSSTESCSRCGRLITMSRPRETDHDYCVGCATGEERGCEEVPLG